MNFYACSRTCQQISVAEIPGASPEEWRPLRPSTARRRPVGGRSRTVLRRPVTLSFRASARNLVWWPGAMNDREVLGQFGPDSGPTRPDIATDGERYLVVWRTTSPTGDHDVDGASIDRAGNITHLAIATLRSRRARPLGHRHQQRDVPRGLRQGHRGREVQLNQPGRGSHQSEVEICLMKLPYASTFPYKVLDIPLTET